ncbi:MAG: hypothetical protein U9Q40_03110 [Campylobacterota bacterium]|nr:hypothetical protein [Campylobacterota bacterium]
MGYTATLRQGTYTTGSGAMTTFSTKGSQLTKTEHDDTHKALFQAFELRTLSGDTDVTLSTPASKQLLIYDGSVWKNKTLSGDGVITVDGALTVSKIGGKSITLADSFTTSGANTLTLTTTGATNVTLPTAGTLMTTTLADAKFLIGSGVNVATAYAISGDIGITNAGVASISAGVILNTDINSSAAIALSKLEALTFNRALVSDGSGKIIVSAVTATEIGYLDGVTGNIKTQFDNLIDGTTTLTSVNIDAGTIDGVTIGSSSACTKLTVDNIVLDGLTIETTTTGTSLILDSGDDLTLQVGTGSDIILSGDSGGDIKIGRALDKIGFFDTTPVVQTNAYTVSNYTDYRTFDCDGLTNDQLADAIGTLIKDLGAYGLLDATVT